MSEKEEVEERTEAWNWALENASGRCGEKRSSTDNWKGTVTKSRKAPNHKHLTRGDSQQQVSLSNHAKYLHLQFREIFTILVQRNSKRPLHISIKGSSKRKDFKGADRGNVRFLGTAWRSPWNSAGSDPKLKTRQNLKHHPWHIHLLYELIMRENGILFL